LDLVETRYFNKISHGRPPAGSEGACLESKMMLEGGVLPLQWKNSTKS
jgi:hypothetical protein